MQALVERLYKFISEDGILGEQLAAIVNELDQGDSPLFLCTDVHGNHVAQMFIQKFRATQNPQEPDMPGTEAYAQFTDFLYRACASWPVEIGTHKQGCCVMQRCLEKGLLSQKLMLSEVIVAELPSLIEDQYGNYLVQNVLKINSE